MAQQPYGPGHPKWTTLFDGATDYAQRLEVKHWAYDDGRQGYYVDVRRDGGQITAMRPFATRPEAFDYALEFCAPGKAPRGLLYPDLAVAERAVARRRRAQLHKHDYDPTNPFSPNASLDAKIEFYERMEVVHEQLTAFWSVDNLPALMEHDRARMIAKGREERDTLRSVRRKLHELRHERAEERRARDPMRLGADRVKQSWWNGQPIPTVRQMWRRSTRKNDIDRHGGFPRDDPLSNTRGFTVGADAVDRMFRRRRL